MKQVRLMMVTGDNNNNKYYNMDENGDGTFTASFGRVGANPQKQNYSMGEWDKIYKSKVKKGYKDLTPMKKVGTAKPIENPEVAAIIDRLNSYSRTRVSDNYAIAVDAVTPQQLTEAQSLVDAVVNNKVDLSVVNKALVDLYTILPRRMKNVRDFLATPETNLDSIIKAEQDLLDGMRTQVAVYTGDSDVTILDTLGLDLQPITATDRIIIQGLLSNYNFIRGFKVVNKATQARYNGHLEQAQNKQELKLWHGSKNANFMSIMSQGLKIRPSSASYNGSRFGKGTYFANDFGKSLGYTENYMFIFSVHVGSQYVTQRDNSSLSLDFIKQYGHDSVLADVRPQEIIVFRDEQSTVEYLLQIR